LSLAAVRNPSLDGADGADGADAAFTLSLRISPEIFENEGPVVSRTERVPTAALESEGSDKNLECPSGSPGSEYCDSPD
jgi:hypothetical protein